MATLYVDLISGNDTTGDGSAGTPYLTVNKAHSIASGPHDIRVAKTTAYTSVACAGAGVGWTNNSTTVTTSADLRASIAVGEYIGKTTAAGNGSNETFFRVNAISATVITLEHRYTGTTATEATCNKLVVITTGSAAANAMTLSTNGTILSGGWNLTGTPAQDGETWFKSNNVRTAGYQGILQSGSATISKMNCVETNYACNIGVTTLSECTMYGYAMGIRTQYGTAIIEDCVAINIATNNPMYVDSLSPTITRTTLIAPNVAFVGVGGAAMTMTECKFYNGNSMSVGGASMTFTDNEFYNCALGVSAGNNAKVERCTFSNCTTAIANVSSVSGFYVKDCTFSGGAYGLYSSVCHGAYFEGCTFTNCSYGLYLDQYCGDFYIHNCSFITPTNYALFRAGTNTGTMFVYSTTIDGASIAKAYNVNASAYTLKQFVLQNAFGLWGTVYGTGSLMKESSVYRTAAPSKSVSWTGTTTGSPLDIKLWSCLCASGAGKTFTFYLKASSASWAGTLVPKWKLDGATIKTETTITSLTTSWVQYSYTVAGGLITADGELSLELMPNMNAYTFYADDLTIS